MATFVVPVRATWLICLSLVWAQSKREIDSLERLVSRPRLPDTAYAAAYINLAKAYLNINERKALNYARQAATFAERARDRRRQVLSLYYQASALYYAGSFDQANALLSRTESLMTRMPPDVGLTVQILNLKAALAESMGNTVEAQTFYQRSLEEARRSGQPRLLAMTLINIAELYLNLNLYELAEENVQEAIAIAEKTKELEYLRNALKTLSQLYVKQGKYGEAVQVQRRILGVAHQAGIREWVKEAYGFAITQAVGAGLAIADTLLKEAESVLSKDTLLWAELLNWVAAESFIPQGRYARAKDLLQTALSLARSKGDSTFVVRILLNFSNVYIPQALYPQAMEHLLEARRICENLQDSTLLPLVLNNLGKIYSEQEDWQKALEYYSMAANYANLAPDRNFPFQVASNLAVTQTKLGNIDAARNLFRESLLLAEEAEDWQSAARSLINLAILELEQKNVTLARQYLQEAIQYAQKSRDPYTVAVAYITQGQFALQAERLNEAIVAYEKARQTLEPLEAYSELAEVYEKLILLYGRVRAFDKAYQYIQPLLEVTRRLSDKENAQAMTRLELNYLYQKEREEQERRLEAERLRTEKARQITWVIIISAIVLIAAATGFSIVLYRKNQREREINAELAERNRLIEDQKALLEKQKADLEQAKREIDESIEYAKRIQLAILPDLAPLYERFPESFVLYLPRDVVSGDFYFFHPLSPTQSLLAVADCTGHGVPGAFMSMIGTTLLNRLAQEEGPKDPAFLLQRLDEELRLTLHHTLNQSKENIKDGMDIALCMIDTEKHLLHFAGAKRPLFLFSPEGDFTEVRGSRRAIGGDELHLSSSFESHTIPLRPKMSFYLFSDGIVDQFGWEKVEGGGVKRSKFMPRRLRELLKNTIHLPAMEQKAYIERYITEWRGDIEQLDDICLIGVRYTG